MNQGAQHPERESARLYPRPVAARRRRAKAILLIVMAVLAGVVIGAGGAVIYFQRETHRPPRPDIIAQAIVERMRQLMHLTPEEEATVSAIVSARMQEVEEIRRSSFREVRGVFDAMDVDMAEKLGEDRVERWKEYKEQKRQERKWRHLDADRKGHSDKKGPIDKKGRPH